MPTTITLTAAAATVVLTGDGVYLGPTYDKLEGWYGVSSDDSGFAKRPDAPGEFEPGQTFAEGRTVSIEGQYFSPTGRADALAMRKTIASLYNSGLPIAMTVADDLETTTRSVYVLDIKFPWTIHQEFAFTIDMRAADPRRYGLTDVRETGLALASLGLDFGAYTYWTGTPNASTSVLTDGTTTRTNLATDPHATRLASNDGWSTGGYGTGGSGTQAIDPAAAVDGGSAVVTTWTATPTGGGAQIQHIFTTSATPSGQLTAYLDVVANQNVQGVYLSATGGATGATVNLVAGVPQRLSVTSPLAAGLNSLTVFFRIPNLVSAGVVSGTRITVSRAVVEVGATSDGIHFDGGFNPSPGLDFGSTTPNSPGLDFGVAPSDGRIVVVNTGNADALTVLKVRDETGQMTDGFTIVNVDTGQTLTYVGTVTRGTVITLDPKTRQAYVNDVNPVGRFLPSPEWWSTPAMSTTTLQFLANGTVTGSPVLRAETAAANY